MPISRLFRLLYILLERERVPAPELAQTLEVSVRTIYRDVQLKAALEQAGFHDIEIHKNEKGWLCMLARK